MSLDEILGEIRLEYKNPLEIMEQEISPERQKHIQGCVRLAYSLGIGYGLNPKSAVLTAMFHDYFREKSNEDILKMAQRFGVKPTKFEKKYPKVLHGKVAAAYFQKKGFITDLEILEGIANHTLAHKDMGPYGMLMFVVDAAEETRKYPGIAVLRKTIQKDSLTEAFRFVLKKQIIDMINKGKVLAKATIQAYNTMEENK